MKKLSRQHKIYLAILGLALLCLIVDRMILGPGKAAASFDSSEYLVQRSTDAQHSQARPIESPGPSAGARVVDPNAYAHPLVARLESLAKAQSLDTSNVTDAFWSSWMHQEEPKPTSVDLQPIDHDEVLARNFKEKYRLMAIMETGPRGYVIIGGERPITLTIGEALDGFTLIAVADRSAVFVRNNVRVELALPKGQ